MTLALSFVNAWLLIGLAAAAIPVALHLLSSVRAPEVFFPTLRFVKMSMDKTARRRRLEHWLLLLIRSLLLAMLALAVAEPILESAGGFLGDGRTAAVVILDNSYSMGMRSGGETRFRRARRELGELLGGPDRPSEAALILTNTPPPPAKLTAEFSTLRERLGQSSLASGAARVADAIKEARRLLAESSAPAKAIYVFSDRQRLSFEGLDAIARSDGAAAPVILVDCSGPPADNVGISELTVVGRTVVSKKLVFTATLVNSSPGPKSVQAALQIDGRPVGRPVRVSLAPGGENGSKATVKFARRLRTAGNHQGQVAIRETDALAADNVRRFSLDIAPPVGAVVVRGPARADAAFGPAAALRRILDPVAGTDIPWSVRLLRIVAADEFDAASLTDAQVVVLADVPHFTPEQAGVLERFVRRGGSAIFFLGPATEPLNYNEQLVGRIPDFGGLLPGRIGKALGQIGLTAPAFRAAIDSGHPYLAGLYETPADYPEVLVQRYYRVAPAPTGAETILAAPSGDPIVSAKDFGAGRVVLVATTAGGEWHNLPKSIGANIFLPMIERICLEAGAKRGGDRTFPAGKAVTIRPAAKTTGGASINLTDPDGNIHPLPLSPAPGGAIVRVTDTRRPGLYRWELAGAGAEVEGAWGSFATNMDGAESDLADVSAADIAAAMDPVELYVGGSLAEARAAAADAAAGDNWWDRLLVVVILLLVIEAAVANRLRRTAAVPAHLNPRLAE